MYEDDKNSSNNSGYGQNNGYSGGYNSYTSNSTPYGNSPYSNPQSSYGYGGNGQGYGTYQYSTNQNASGGEIQKPKKKKNVAAIVLSTLLCLVIAGGAVFGGIYFFRGGKISSGKVQQAQVEQKEDDTQAAPEQTQDQTASAKDAQDQLQTTTVTGETRAVVTDVTGVVAEVMPAMVIIHNNYTASANWFGYTQKEEATASGSGIIVGQNDSELLIATNYHVVEGADSLDVIFSDEESVSAVVKGVDSERDLAVIAIAKGDIPAKTLESIKVATLGDSNSLKLGEPAIAIGNALGYGQSVTTGVISAINREVEVKEGVKHTFIQTDAAINPGNSGGALLNINGEVIGINSNKLGGGGVEAMGYAIPISEAKPIIYKLMNEETKIKVSDEERGFIGISGVSVTNEVSQAYGLPQGVYVAAVAKDGGAEQAGIRKGDVIVEFDGEEITSMDDLQTRLQFYKAGTQVKIKVMRSDGTEYSETEVDVVLGKGDSKTSQDSNAAEDNESGSDQQEESNAG